MLYKVQLDYRLATIANMINRQYATERYLQLHKELLIAICNHDEILSQEKMYELQEELASILASSND
jgi:GntR family transcriptional regulator, galactonate operon transcriptional repressor